MCVGGGKGSSVGVCVNVGVDVDANVGVQVDVEGEMARERRCRAKAVGVADRAGVAGCVTLSAGRARAVQPRARRMADAARICRGFLFMFAWAPSLLGLILQENELDDQLISNFDRLTSLRKRYLLRSGV